MEIKLTESARRYLQEQGEQRLTVASLLFSSCCSGPLPPEVKPGSPGDSEGFTRLSAGDLTVFFDTLLDPRPEILIDLKDYGSYRELFIQGWE